MPGKETRAAPKVAAKAAAPIKKTAAPAKKEEKKAVPAVPSLFAARPKDFGIGRDVPYKRDISRFMRWPAFVTRQRKRRVLERRLKVPPALNQFRKVLDRSTRTELLKLVKKYKPETRKERKARLAAAAEQKKKDPKKTVSTRAAPSVITGLQEVTRAIEKKKAKMVIVANNVDPVELVLWIPTLCRSLKVPYAIVKDKARLGEAIGQRTATVVAITSVKSEDEANLKALTKSVNARFMARSDLLRRQWGGLCLSLRSVAKMRKRRADKNKASQLADKK
jgi:large subunit ribosomal protein L7Ae